MENLKIRCRFCEKEIEGNSAKSVSCGCSNMATIICNNKITAMDLSMIVMLNQNNRRITNNVLRNEDLMWQEARRQRKVRRLDFEIR